MKEPAILWDHYSKGWFLWSSSGIPFFHRPNDVRAVLRPDGMRVSRSLARSLNSGRFQATFDTCFAEVMHGCADRPASWLTPVHHRIFREAHRNGWAHSAEVWVDGRLAGGVYGVAVGRVFCGESMFTRETGAGKAAHWALMHRLEECGFELLDSQFLNPHTESLGVVEIPAEEFDRILRHGLAEPKPVWRNDP
ncbi:MAG: leucyl/phenylalanyl-tRNA--protein transferase, partial [Fimbriimonadaceae bacterium]|nr:leucyl/phenylalanyl-tRNA--protein transferase [Fimbriimonadaceae bacterium]